MHIAQCDHAQCACTLAQCAHATSIRIGTLGALQTCTAMGQTDDNFFPDVQVDRSTMSLLFYSTVATVSRKEDVFTLHMNGH